MLSNSVHFKKKLRGTPLRKLIFILFSQIEQLFVNYTQVSGHRLNPRNSYHRQTIMLISDIFISNKVLLIGDANVGKTSFLQRYTRNTFRQDYKGTVGVDFALKILHMSDQDTLVKLQLWDVAGKCTCCITVRKFAIFLVPHKY